MKKLTTLLLSGILSISSIFTAFALPTGATFDPTILSDPVENIYFGFPDATAQIYNLDFQDVPSDHWAKEAIIRCGALDIIKGYDNTYSPNDSVTNEEALAFILRSIGYETTAQALAVATADTLPPNSLLRDHWSLGYLTLASQFGLITQDELGQAFAIPENAERDADGNLLMYENVFLAQEPAQREQITHWIITAMQIQYPSMIPAITGSQKILQYDDWDTISVEYANSVELASRMMILQGSDGSFLPKEAMTRAQMAMVLKNMDTPYLEAANISEKYGTIGAMVDSQVTLIGSADLTRGIYIRTSDGDVDVINYYNSKSASPNPGTMDVVVLKDGEVGGVDLLEEGDKIKYLVDNNTYYTRFIHVTTSAQIEERTVEGKLTTIDVISGTITISDDSGKEFVYVMNMGMYGSDELPVTASSTFFVYMDEVKRNVTQLPLGSTVMLNLKNNVVSDMFYIGEPVLIPELHGIVLENNPDFGYLIYLDDNGNKVTKNYYTEDLLTVKKREYYDLDDEIGYIDQVFPSFTYNPMNADISSIEPGDVIFIRVDPENPDNILEISASTNYTMQYGQIKSFSVGDDYSSMLLEYETGQLAWYEIPQSIFVSKGGFSIGHDDIMVGDWAKLLINEALIEPGWVTESVKEVTIDSGGHEITTIVRGQMAGVDYIQNNIIIQNAQTLEKTGWQNHREIEYYNLGDSDTEIYHEDKLVSMDYVDRFLKRADGEVYLALENSYAGEQIQKITFRSERDEVLDPDIVVNSNGNGTFDLLGIPESIGTDAGSIVVRHGRLVTGQNIMAPDYATVVLNGENSAAIVTINDAPGSDEVVLARGRIQTIDDGRSFTVQSMAFLTDNEWVYTPIQREFVIDYDTLFIGPDGPTDMSTFITYTEDSVVDIVYNFVIDGSRADIIVDLPSPQYPDELIRGTIYSIDGTTISLKDVTYYDDNDKKWVELSYINNTAFVTGMPNALYIKYNEISSLSELEVGDQIKVMTNNLPDNPGPGLEIEGFLIFGEK